MMSLRDLHSDSQGRVGYAQATIGANGATNGAIIDLAGYQASEWYVYAQAITDGTYVLSLQHGDASNLSDAVAVPADQVFGAGTQFLATDDNKVKRIGYHGDKQYVRLVITASGVTTGGLFSATAVVASPLHAPVPND